LRLSGPTPLDSFFNLAGQKDMIDFSYFLQLNLYQITGPRNRPK